MIYVFEDLELDTRLFELRRDGEPCRIEPQVFDVLLYLIENRDRIVTKDDLFGHVWKDRFVSDSALSSRLKAARAAIGDRGSQQRLIKTIHGRGFRFVGDVSEKAAAAGAPPPAMASDNRVEVAEAERPAAPVGRRRELKALGAALDTAKTGRRQVVFVTGEAGFGKTTLLHAFLDTIADGSLRLAHGQCLEHHGAGEAYMPILEALGRLCREDPDQQVLNLLSERAPTWMAQMPWYGGEPDADDTQNQLRGGTQNRMLREMVEALEALAVETPLLLVLEDIHWSDPSTVDLLTWLAARTDEARLMVVATYRPADLKAGLQSLSSAVQTLIVRERGQEIPLDVLDEASIADYLAQRFEAATFPPELASALHQRTHGNPLFMENVVEHWIADGSLINDTGAWRLTVEPYQLTRAVPPNLKQFIEQFIEELEPQDHAILAAAAVAGPEFTTVELAAATESPEQDAESRCATLAQRGRWIRTRDVAEWPDGTVSSAFAFNHDLYHEVLYEGVPAGQRVSMHRRIGERLESAYGNERAQNAGELARHFVAGRTIPKAIEYLRLAAGQALRRVAPREAIVALRKALELVPRLPTEGERDRTELALQIMLAPPLIATEGVGSANAEAAYKRARELCDCVQEQSELQHVLYGMGAMYEVRGEFTTSEALMHERLELPSQGDDDLLRVETHELLACSLFHQGEFGSALEQADAGIRMADLTQHSITAPAFGENPGISCQYWAGLALWFTGHPEQALDRIRAGIEQSENPDQHYALSTAYAQAAVLHQLMRDVDETTRWAELTESIGNKQGYALRTAMGRILGGWAKAMKGDTPAGIDALIRGIGEAQAIGADMDRAYFLGLLAEAYYAAGQAQAGLDAINLALSALHGRTHFFYAAELYRLQGLLLQKAPDTGSARAEAAFQQALDVARAQSALTMELRAATSLAQLWCNLGRQDEEAGLLENVLDKFEPGLDTRDLRDARELLQAL
jgi:DNA-binding winged helix-turn-helix (wHTH) protein/type II secretory pathway predicted ATPase ExeA/tetratricopeptide (TPR) repeat protein